MIFKAKCFNAALLAGFISRQTKGGKMLEGTDGWIPCNNPANGNCFGIMHINDFSMNYHGTFLTYKLLP